MADSDEDGVPDEAVEYKFYFNIKSDPTKKDSNNDDIYDKYDLEPLILNQSYDRNAVYAYAHEWSGDFDTTGEKYNYSEYPNFAELSDQISDCTNFVSQCLYAGGFNMSDDWYFEKTQSLPSHIAGIFSSTGTLNYSWTKSWSVVVDNYNHFRSNDYAMYEISINRNESIQNAISNYDIRVGDLIYFCRDNVPTHAAIISSIQNDDICYAAHSYARWNKPLSETLTEDEGYSNVIIICLSGRIPS